MKKILFLSIILVLVLTSCDYQQKDTFSREQYFFLITIDGLRPDYIELAETKNIDLMLKDYNATMRYNSRTVCPSITPIVHASLFTGKQPEEHKYKNPGDDVFAETIFQKLESKGYKTLLLDGKGGRLKGLEKNVTYFYGEKDYRFQSGDLEVMSDFINYVKINDPAFAFVLLPGVDSFGHGYGHESQEYLDAINVADQSIGLLLNMIIEENIFEKTNIIIVSDHGMTGKDHGACLSTDTNITLIKMGNFFEPNQTVPQNITELFEEINGAHSSR